MTYVLPTTLLFLVIYFAPSLVAVVRRHRDTGWIILLNIFAGWSGLGWIAALVWAS